MFLLLYLPTSIGNTIMENDQNPNSIIIAFIILIIGIILSFICFFNEHILWFFVILLITTLISGSIWQNQKDAKIRKEQELKRKERAIQREQRTLIYNQHYNELISKYGVPDKALIVEEHNLDTAIIAFGKVNRIWLLGKDLPMSDILGCTFSDNPRIKRGNMLCKTTTNTNDMIKRAWIGDFLHGEKGAIIGGSTASKETVIKFGNDRTIHNYTVNININSLSNPIMTINLGSNAAAVNEIIGLMNVIINRRQ